MKRYSVLARPRGKHLGFRRSGIAFSSTVPTILSDSEITPEIQNEPMLVVTEITEEQEQEAPERIPCPHCDKDYANEDTLAEHIEKKHPEVKREG